MAAKADPPIPEWDRREQEQSALIETGAETVPTESVMLTSRQQRALLYISRRHMRHPRITSRPPHNGNGKHRDQHKPDGRLQGVTQPTNTSLTPTDVPIVIRDEHKSG